VVYNSLGLRQRVAAVRHYALSCYEARLVARQKDH
jgi:hypothetical protein